MESKVAAAYDYALGRQLETELVNLENFLSDGRVADFAEYRYLCGQIRGIRFAQECLIHMRKRLGQDEDADS